MSLQAAETFAEQCKMDEHATQSTDENGTIDPICHRVQVAVYHNGEEVVVSDWAGISVPGDQDSVDDAWYEAACDAEDKFVSYLADRFEIDTADASDAAGMIPRPDMPAW